MIEIKNNADTATIQIFGEIGKTFWSDGWTLERFTDAIKGLTASNLVVELKSTGGDLLESFAIYDALRIVPARVTVRIVGASASAATVIASGADRIEISENSRYLVHNAQTFVEGNKEALKDVYEQLASFDNQILDIYIKRTGRTRDELAELMKAERWMSAVEALEWGFVDSIIKSKIENNMKKFANLTPDEQAEMDALTKENETLKAKVAELQTKLDEIGAVEKKKEEELIEKEVADAIAAGKITAESKPSWIAIGKTDHASMITILNAIQKTDKISDVVGGTSPGKITKEKFWQNYKAGVYTNEPAKYDADFKEAFNK